MDVSDEQPRFDGASASTPRSHRTWRLRAEAAGRATRAANVVSRRLRLGSGTVAGGRVGMAIDPGLLARLARDRQVSLVSGTNGKTTTTALLTRALQVSSADVVTNATGANMPAGHLAAS